MSRFLKLDITGQRLPADATDHALVRDTTTGLEWLAKTLDKRMTHRQAEKACAALDHAGGGWRLPTDHELLGLVDRSRYAPAIDTEAFPDAKSSWYWTSTLHASDSSYAWIVYFYDGGADYCHRDGYNAFVRAVRAVPAGQ